MSEGGRPFPLALARVAGVDQAAGAAAAAHQQRLTKPRGSLGRLEDLGVRLAAISGQFPPPMPEPAVVVVFAGDHGVVVEGVSPWPQEVTAQMVANFGRGGAAISALARQTGADVFVVDVGVAGPVDPYPSLLDRKVRAGTANLAKGPAMTAEEVATALDAGAAVAAEVVADGARALITGDMGIGNTTPSAALVAAFTGRAPAEVTGRGTGIDDATWAGKVEIVGRAVDRAAAEGALDAGPVATLASLGGLEIAALAGFIAGGAAARVPVLVDGVVALAALLPVAALAPDVVDYCVAGHRSTEPGASATLAHLEMVPLLDLGLRLGEGSGACMALPLLQASARILREMATFDQAGVTEK